MIPILCAPLLLLAPAQEPPPPKTVADDADPRAVQLFLANCATCHGETGDGKGVTKLDRPARSFQDGGFSFGNTPDALFRTISIGIPGSPMPSFEGSLAPEDRRLLAEYVVSLGPESTSSTEEERVMRVGDRPVVVRGHFPPIVDGGRDHVRGLLLGTPAGMHFEYAADDVRLVGVRMGELVERTDWLGRGGSALRPLGAPVYVCGQGDPGPAFALPPRTIGDGAAGAPVPLGAGLLATFVEGDDVGLRYRLSDGGRTYCLVEESVEVVPTYIGAAFRRRLRFFDVTRTSEVWARVREGGEVLETFETMDMDGLSPTEWAAVRAEDGTMECISFHSDQRHLDWAREGRSLFARVQVTERQLRFVEVLHLFPTEWTDSTRNFLELGGVR